VSKHGIFMVQHSPLVEDFACPHAMKFILGFLLSLMRQGENIQNRSYSNYKLNAMFLLVHENPIENAQWPKTLLLTLLGAT